LLFGRGGYFFEERAKSSPSSTNANMINPSVFFIAAFYHNESSKKGPKIGLSLSEYGMPRKKEGKFFWFPNPFPGNYSTLQHGPQ
jgi:hypothetical protein